jgi:hypothetical protein
MKKRNLNVLNAFAPRWLLITGVQRVLAVCKLAFTLQDLTFSQLCWWFNSVGMLRSVYPYPNTAVECSAFMTAVDVAYPESCTYSQQRFTSANKALLSFKTNNMRVVNRPYFETARLSEMPTNTNRKHRLLSNTLQQGWKSFWVRVPKLSINFEEFLSCDCENFEEQNKAFHNNNNNNSYYNYNVQLMHSTDIMFLKRLPRRTR